MGKGYFYKTLTPNLLPHTLEIIRDRKIFCLIKYCLNLRVVEKVKKGGADRAVN